MCGGRGAAGHSRGRGAAHPPLHPHSSSSSSSQAECAALSRDKDRWHAEEVLARKASAASQPAGALYIEPPLLPSLLLLPLLQQLSALKAQRDLKSRELAAISNDRKAAVELSKVKELTVRGRAIT